jgi:hypothetical protein
MKYASRSLTHSVSQYDPKKKCRPGWQPSYPARRSFVNTKIRQNQNFFVPFYAKQNPGILGFFS